MSPVLTVVISIVVLIVGIAMGYVLRKNLGEKAIGSAEQQARNMILDAQNTVENLKKEKVLEAKEEIHKLRDENEAELKVRRNEVSKAERRIQQKEENIDRKLESIEKRENGLTKREQSMNEKHKEIDAYIAKQVEELERISGYTREEAKHLLLQELVPRIGFIFQDVLYCRICEILPTDCPGSFGIHCCRDSGDAFAAYEPVENLLHDPGVAIRHEFPVFCVITEDTVVPEIKHATGKPLMVSHGDIFGYRVAFVL